MPYSSKLLSPYGAGRVVLAARRRVLDAQLDLVRLEPQLGDPRPLRDRLREEREGRLRL
jgi:hypothetical protein